MVWLLGISPFLAHLASSDPSRGYARIPNDLYLFVMVTGGTLGMDAFKDQQSRGPIRSLAGVIGFCAIPAGAWAYGALQAGTTPVAAVLRTSVAGVIAALFCIDIIYRAPKIIGAAIQEQAKEVNRAHR